ncbi:transporter substrate-binding domain-containing protein [Rossellomorea marisflavi]|uniref:Transporter substrate-binding domain-containing protein n=2 Tax=Rossellomorea marisflavi TaxID=189381 RepID=A0A5D4RY08_9BACI|nr:transporter substrate-binding domain-containing protein [Rossellomorea marisflavi]
MKKSRLLVVLAVLMTVASILSACGSKAKEGAMEKIKEEGTIRVGLMGTYQPYNFLNDNKEMDGFDADIAKEVAKRLDVKVKFVTQDFSGMIAGLKADKFDVVISQMTITDERKKQMAFSDPYITNSVKVIVKEDDKDIQSVDDFKGRDIGVGLGTNDETYLRTELLPKVGDFTIKTYDDVFTSLKDLDAGRIDATINNMYALKPIVEKNGFNIKAVGEPIKSDQAGIAAKKGNEDIIKAINPVLADMKKDGTYNEIFKKWFGEEPEDQPAS